MTKPCMVCGKEIEDKKINVCDRCYEENITYSKKHFPNSKKRKEK